jgi:hypothetical protein
MLKVVILKLGSISPTFLSTKQSSFCVDNFECFLWKQRLAKMGQNMSLRTKAVAKHLQQIFRGNVGETDCHLLRQLNCTCGFAYCTNWLVILTSATSNLIQNL